MNWQTIVIVSLICSNIYFWYAASYFHHIGWEMVYAWMLSDLKKAEETVIVLEKHNVPHTVLNIFKEKLRCTELRLLNNGVQPQDSMPAKVNAE